MECLVALLILSIIVAFTLPALGNVFNIRSRQKNYLEFTNYSKTVTENIIAQISTGSAIAIPENENYDVEYELTKSGDFRKLKVKITDRDSEREQVYETILPK